MEKPKPPPGLLATRPAAAYNRDESLGPNIGRPPAQYTDGLRDQICELIRKGNRPHVAAQISGITRSTFDRWMSMGRAGNTHMWEFSDAVEMAVAVFEGRAVEAVVGKDGAFGEDVNPENAKFILERRFADGYSKELNAKVQAYLEDFMGRLKANLPELITDDMVGLNMFEVIAGAAQGERLAAVRQTFKLGTHGGDKEDGSADEKESVGSGIEPDEDGDEGGESDEA